MDSKKKNVRKNFSQRRNNNYPTEENKDSQNLQNNKKMINYYFSTKENNERKLNDSTQHFDYVSEHINKKIKKDPSHF